MKHLDTNILISLTDTISTSLEPVLESMDQGEEYSCSSVTWSEYCNGPCTPEQRRVALAIVRERVLPLERTQAELAAELFNLTGRRRGSHPDCMIAACAISEQASLLSLNRRDFEKFVPHGLSLESLVNER